MGYYAAERCVMTSRKIRKAVVDGAGVGAANSRQRSKITSGSYWFQEVERKLQITRGTDLVAY